MSIFSIIRRNEDPTAVGATAPQRDLTPARSVPPLMLLTADAAGPSTRRLHIFADAKGAADYIDFWFPAAQRSDVLAFWALPSDPASTENKGEAESTRATVDSAPPTESQDQVIVMIRHAQHTDSVYPFSFADVSSANDFVRREMKRGLDLRSVGIYWAAFAEIDSLPDGSAAITPSTPPTPGPAPIANASPVEATAALTQTEPGPNAAPDPERSPAADPIAAFQAPASQQPSTTSYATSPAS
jgi:hypothetical protein